MRTTRVSFIIITLITVVLFTSCLDVFKTKSNIEFIHPNLHIGHIVKKKSKGVGHVKEVSLIDSISEILAKKGTLIYEKKCVSCHKLTDQRIVGPGWAGITNNRRPEWIMNMIINTDEMLDYDEEAIIQLEDCLTRMPPQDLTIEEARSVLEFMRVNDLKQVHRKDGAIKY
ncbi:cytochrome c [uncultured Formosa sp.]|uniref:c-type cytochrome n=1 Tax=uncultured Formosa sp. TaxID=255435 RepID=UPI0026302246|nr:cytochrome c [uncultured Formosa sp.]